MAVNADGNSKIGGVSHTDDWLNNELSGNRSLNDKNETMSKKSPKFNSISTIIRSYKSAVTKHANRLDIPNGWQTRFHDHIIRDSASYSRISKYIKTTSPIGKMIDYTKMDELYNNVP